MGLKPRPSNSLSDRQNFRKTRCSVRWLMAHNTSLEAKTVRYAVAKMLSEDIFRFPRCWGILEQHWNGTLLRDLPTLLA